MTRPDFQVMTEHVLPQAPAALARLEQGGRVLDVGCGGGRACLHLQGRGLAVVGIDTSAGAVACCAQRGVRDVRRIALEYVPDSLGRFDTIMLLGRNFGMMGSPPRARRLLRRLASLTTARGRIVAETFDPHAPDDPADRRYVERVRPDGGSASRPHALPRPGDAVDGLAAALAGRARGPRRRDRMAAPPHAAPPPELRRRPRQALSGPCAAHLSGRPAGRSAPRRPTPSTRRAACTRPRRSSPRRTAATRSRRRSRCRCR
jgi:SAM-dependent methyltransferase